jgi:4-amino-4-deoxy-L-arabinose transferase-like glycosyltransferase
MKTKIVIISLLVILAIASFFRLWKLSDIPPGLYPDVAINGNDALDSLKTGKFKVFYPENCGREGLMMWLIALSFSVFGVSIWSIKIVAATIGILTVLGLYLLTKELFKTINNQQLTINNEIIALLTAFFLATSFWHTNFSRIGFRAILLPFILVFSFYFLFRGFRMGSINSPQAQKFWNFILAGIFFGLGFYTYTSFRIAVLLLPIVLISWFLIYKNRGLSKKFLLNTIYFLLTIFIVALPIGIYFLWHPQDFISRATGVSIFTQQNPIMAFLISLGKHLGMFNFYGDPNWRHNFAGSPMLPWPLGILFLIGLIFSIKELISSLKNKNYSLFTVHCSLISWFFIMFLPGILTFEGIPHSLRVIGVIPPVYIFVGFGTWKTYEFLNNWVNRKKLLIIAALLFLLVVAFFEFNKYFLVWAKNPNVMGAFTKKFVDIGDYINSLPSEIKKYVIVNESGIPVPWPKGIPMPAQTVMFVERTKYGQTQSNYLVPEDLDKVKIEKDSPNKSLRDYTGQAIIVLMKYDKNILDRIKIIFPEGETEKINEIWIYKVNKFLILNL